MNEKEYVIKDNFGNFYDVQTRLFSADLKEASVFTRKKLPERLGSAYLLFDKKRYVSMCDTYKIIEYKDALEETEQ